MENPLHFSRGERFLALLVCSAISALAPPTALGQVPMLIEGQVLNEQDQAIPSGVTVSLQTRNGTPVGEAPANSWGKFEIANLRRETYLLTVKADGFYSIQQMVDLRAVSGQTLVLRLVLTARPSRAPATTPPPVLSDLRAPREARHEYDRGVRAMHDRKLSEAEAHFQRAIDTYPCYARAETQLGVLLAAQHDFDRAETALEKALNCDGGLPEAYLALGEVLSFRKKYQKSLARLQEGVRLFPGMWQFYDQMAIAHYNLEDYAKAEEEWVKVESLTSSLPPEIHAKLGAVYWRRGNNSKASEEMTAYLRAEPQGRYAEKAKDLLRQIQSSGSRARPPESPPTGPP